MMDAEDGQAVEGKVFVGESGLKTQEYVEAEMNFFIKTSSDGRLPCGMTQD